MQERSNEYAHFLTATNLEWKPLLKDDKNKDIVIDSMRYVIKDKRVIIYAFVIMPNHMHIIWQLRAGRNREDVQRDFLKYTAQQIKSRVRKLNPADLLLFLVNAKDRKYQFWERNPLSIEIWSEKVFMQKLKYIHENPVRAGLCKHPLDYKYSSARFYYDGKDDWGFLTHIRD
jgi:REP-associated tyrosine transposase